MRKSRNFWALSQLVLVVFLLVYTGCSNSMLSTKLADDPSGWEQQVSELDRKIVLLKRWQEGYRMTAEQAQFKADRLQFEENFLIDAKRLWKVAENARQKAQDLQVLIDKLEAQRNKILVRHHQPIPKD